MLRHKLALERRVLAAAGGGSYDQTWTVVLPSVKSWVQPLSSREQLHAMQLETPITHRVVTRYQRYLKDTSTEYRFVMDGDRYFNILGVTDWEERHRWLEIDVAEAIGD